MNFTELAERFAASGGGTDDFKRLYKDAYELMKTDADNAALYFVVGLAAQAYVMKYEDQGVSMALSENAKRTLVAYLATLRRALSAEPAERLRLLGEVAADYQFQVSDF